jgi:hypothetical protein
MKVTSSIRKSWIAAVVAVVAIVGLWIAAWPRAARESGSSAGRGSAATAGARGPASHAARVSPLRSGPPGDHEDDDDIDANAPFDVTESDDGSVDSEPGAAIQPRLHADVHRPLPPEAVLAPQPRAVSRNRDTGLVFRSEPPGNGEAGQTKELKPSGTPEPPNGLTRPPFTADLHRPADPVVWEPAPQAAPDSDTGLRFSSQPLGSTDGSGQKR